MSGFHIANLSCHGRLLVLEGKVGGPALILPSTDRVNRRKADINRKSRKKDEFYGRLLPACGVWSFTHNDGVEPNVSSGLSSGTGKSLI
jgi:hypothetical protein